MSCLLRALAVAFLATAGLAQGLVRFAPEVPSAAIGEEVRWVLSVEHAHGEAPTLPSPALTAPRATLS